MAKPESQHAPGIEYVGGDDDVDQKESPPVSDIIILRWDRVLNFL